MSRYLNAITLDPVFWSVMGSNEISARLMNRMVTLNNSLQDSAVEPRQLHERYLGNIGSAAPDELTSNERFDLLNRSFNQLNINKRASSKKVEPETLWNGSTARQKVEWKQKKQQECCYQPCRTRRNATGKKSSKPSLTPWRKIDRKTLNLLIFKIQQSPQIAGFPDRIVATKPIY